MLGTDYPNAQRDDDVSKYDYELFGPSEMVIGCKFYPYLWVNDWRQCVQKGHLVKDHKGDVYGVVNIGVDNRGCFLLVYPANNVAL